MTPLSSEKDVAPVNIGPGRVSLEKLNELMLKIYQTPDRHLGTDYYLIQREMAKRRKRPNAVRYMLKVVAIVKQGTTFIAAKTHAGSLTTAIGAISADHWYNTGIRDAMKSLLDGSPLENRAIASAFGEAREELRVRPEEVRRVVLLPSAIIIKDVKENRFTAHIFVEMYLSDDVSIRTLEERHYKDSIDKSLSDSFRETGPPTVIRDWRQFGRRTVDLLDAL